MEQDVTARLERGRAALEDVFDEQAVAARKKLARLKTALRKLSGQFARVKATQETTEEAYQVDVSW
ncbi:hypothetical protein FPK51_32300, partial [Acinetobacter baumannii]|nr:hypothetical protein [Acinetobacter baumannii]